MKLSSPISAQTARTLTFGAFLSVGSLYAAEKAAEKYEIELTFDPQTIPSAFSPHPHLLWELPPGETEVNGQSVTINEVGARGPATTWEKGDGTRRVIAIGDEVSFGQGVERDVSFVLDAVNTLGGSRVGVETLILSAPGYSIVQQRNQMDLRGWSLSPDLLVITGPGTEMTVAPYVDHEIIAPVHSLDNKQKRLESLAAYRILNHHLTVIDGPQAIKRNQVFHQQANHNRAGKPRVGVNDYAAHLDAVAETAVNQNIDVIFVIYPLPEDLNDSHMTNRVNLYRTAMIDVAQRHGIPVVDGPEVFKESGRDKERLFQNHRLLSDYGHRTLGYALSKKLTKWMRGRKILRQGTGVALPNYAEPEPDPDGAP